MWSVYKSWRPVVLRECYRRLYAHPILIDWKEYAHTYLDQTTTREELSAHLWHRYITRATTPLPSKRGGTTTILSIFKQMMSDQLPHYSDLDTERLFYLWLAHQCLGMCEEWWVYRNLVQALPDHDVRLAPTSDESLDIDAYIDNLPVSIKTYRGFSERNCAKYRNGLLTRHLPVPVLYINENLDSLVFYQDQWQHRPASSLARVVAHLIPRCDHLRLVGTA